MQPVPFSSQAELKSMCFAEGKSGGKLWPDEKPPKTIVDVDLIVFDAHVNWSSQLT